MDWKGRYANNYVSKQNGQVEPSNISRWNLLELSI